LSILPVPIDHHDLLKRAMGELWRISPAAMAAHLTKDEPQPWLAAPHLNLLSRTIVDAVSGRNPFVIVNMPPRHGKSEEISKWTPVWFLDRWPYKEVINVGYSTEFSEGWGRKVRNLAQQYRSQLRFDLSPDSKSAGRWNTTEGGGMVATGIDGQITGRGADLFIVDDPHKDAAEANSLLKRDRVWQWWTETARSRVMPGGAVILVMTRWHEDDFAGRLLKAAADGTGEKWHVLNLPAIYDADAAKEGPDVMGRAIGDALWPALRPLEYLHALQLGMTQEAWDAQFQGRPGNQAKAGNVYKAFHAATHVRPVVYDPRRPLVWSMDFNVDPMCSVIAQWHEEVTTYTHLTNEKKKVISVLQELCLPNSSTIEMCEAFCDRTEQYRQRNRTIHVRIYGDRSGQSRKTVGDTDYQVIRDFFRHARNWQRTFVRYNGNGTAAGTARVVSTNPIWPAPTCQTLTAISYSASSA
jgi:hypothetical protein